jgi:hypothetical protein
MAHMARTDNDAGRQQIMLARAYNRSTQHTDSGMRFYDTQPRSLRSMPASDERESRVMMLSADAEDIHDAMS